MPKTKKKAARGRKTKTTQELDQELTAVKADIETLRTKCGSMHRTLLHLCCPKEWFEEEIDDEEVLSSAVGVSSFEEWTARLTK